MMALVRSSVFLLVGVFALAVGFVLGDLATRPQPPKPPAPLYDVVFYIGDQRKIFVVPLEQAYVDTRGMTPCLVITKPVFRSYCDFSVAYPCTAGCVVTE